MPATQENPNNLRTIIVQSASNLNNYFYVSAIDLPVGCLDPASQPPQLTLNSASGYTLSYSLPNLSSQLPTGEVQTYVLMPSQAMNLPGTSAGEAVFVTIAGPDISNPDDPNATYSLTLPVNAADIQSLSKLKEPNDINLSLIILDSLANASEVFYVPAFDLVQGFQWPATEYGPTNVYGYFRDEANANGDTYKRIDYTFGYGIPSNGNTTYMLKPVKLFPLDPDNLPVVKLNIIETVPENGTTVKKFKVKASASGLKTHKVFSVGNNQAASAS